MHSQRYLGKWAMSTLKQPLLYVGLCNEDSLRRTGEMELGHLIYFAQGCDYPSTLEYNKDMYGMLSQIYVRDIYIHNESFSFYHIIRLSPTS